MTNRSKTRRKSFGVFVWLCCWWAVRKRSFRLYKVDDYTPTVPGVEPGEKPVSRSPKLLFILRKGPNVVKMAGSVKKTVVVVVVAALPLPHHRQTKPLSSFKTLQLGFSFLFFSCLAPSFPTRPFPVSPSCSTNVFTSFSTGRCVRSPTASHAAQRTRRSSLSLSTDFFYFSSSPTHSQWAGSESDCCLYLVLILPLCVGLDV